MIISEEQAMRVLQHLRSGDWGESPAACRTISPELAVRIRQSVEGLPEVRNDRLEQAKADLLDGTLTSHDVATKMIARLVSDSMR